jgi:pyruvate dehydrogenase E2 component (dihydrolipoamide acetyltransferase)
MPVEITMPQLSDTMSEGTVVKWLKKEGDKVKAGEIIAEIETDKATMEMESFEAGTLARIEAKEGTKVKVGSRIALLAGAGENVEQVKSQSAAAAPASKKSSAEIGGEGDEKNQGNHAKPSSSKSIAEVRQPSAASRDTLTMPMPAGGGESASRVRISPLARKIAADRGVDLTRIKGTGPNGRIVQRDIEGVLASGPPSAKEAQGFESLGIASRVASGQKQVIPLTKIRATIAQRLQQSKQQIPHFYESIDIDVEEVSQMRVSMNKALEKQNIRLSLGDFVAKAIAVALQRNPALNAHFSGNEITRFGDVHLGMAVALPEGLIVPVLRNINQMGLKEIRQRSADLVERARAQKLKGDEMTGATFTVSNLGTYGVKEFSAIINPPEVGILAIAAAEKRPVFRGESVVGRTIMNVTLSADHRAVDGATAAEFLRTLKDLLQEPAMMLL